MYPKGKGSTPPSDAQAKEKLIMNVYEFLILNGAKTAATEFLREIRYDKQVNVGESPGFLAQWWGVFYDLFAAAPERRDAFDHSNEAKAFHDYGFVNSGSMPGNGLNPGGPTSRLPVIPPGGLEMRTGLGGMPRIPPNRLHPGFPRHPALLAPGGPGMFPGGPIPMMNPSGGPNLPSAAAGQFLNGGVSLPGCPNPMVPTTMVNGPICSGGGNTNARPSSPQESVMSGGNIPTSQSLNNGPPQSNNNHSSNIPGSTMNGPNTPSGMTYSSPPEGHPCGNDGSLSNSQQYHSSLPPHSQRNNGSGPLNGQNGVLVSSQSMMLLPPNQQHAMMTGPTVMGPNDDFNPSIASHMLHNPMMNGGAHHLHPGPPPHMMSNPGPHCAGPHPEMMMNGPGPHMQGGPPPHMMDMPPGSFPTHPTLLQNHPPFIGVPPGGPHHHLHPSMFPPNHPIHSMSGPSNVPPNFPPMHPNSLPSSLAMDMDSNMMKMKDRIPTEEFKCFDESGDFFGGAP